jgi:membrane protease YdiL (CAAX protease family)
MRVAGIFDPGRLPLAGEIAARLSLLIACVLLVFAGRSLTSSITGPDPDFILYLGLQGATLSLFVGLAWVPLHSPVGKVGLRRAWWGLPAVAFVLIPFCAVTLARGVSGVPPGTAWFVAMGYLLLAAAAEEIEFRGFLLDTLSFRGTMIPSMIITSMLFGWVHTDNPGSNPLALANIALFGILLCGIRFLTRGLAAPILVHWLWNAVTGMVLGVNVSGLQIPSVLRPDGPLPWGAFGPEESPALTILLAASIAGVFTAVFRARRARKMPLPAQAG